jgi:hypothetical protein
MKASRFFVYLVSLAFALLFIGGIVYAFRLLSEEKFEPEPELKEIEL